MSDSTITGTPAEKNRWYWLTLKRSPGKPSTHFWNGYMRHLMEYNGKSAEADEVRIIGYDGEKVDLPQLTFGELNEVTATIGSSASMDQISFAGCIFDSDADFQSFYFPTNVVFSHASFEGEADFMNASFAGGADFTGASFAKMANFNGVSFAGEAKFSKASFSGGAHFTNASFAYPANFTDSRIGGEADFSEASFAGEAKFSKARFAKLADFTDAKFKGGANFSKANFDGRANFTGANFGRSAHFSKVIFGETAEFKNACFKGLAHFSEANFAERAVFSKASFAERAVFSKASFENTADFGGVRFKDNTNFRNASFGDTAVFSKARFENTADFSASSVTPPHKGSVSFASAIFKLAPSFFERQLHEDTDWQGVKWPEPPSSKGQAGDDVGRYESLSLMMSKLGKYDDMHTFFRLSMRTKEIRDGRWSFASVMSRIYGILCDYGRGVERAFSFWAGHILLGFLFILGLMFVKGDLQSIGAAQSLALSFSNAHSFIGFRSGALENLYDAADDVPWCDVIWGVQTLVGLPLLFLLLLTIRNRFRMR